MLSYDPEDRLTIIEILHKLIKKNLILVND